MMPQFDRVDRRVTLAFRVTGAEEMRDRTNVTFQPDMVELRYARLDAVWVLHCVDVSGPGVDLPGSYFRVGLYAGRRPFVTRWLWDFVLTIDVDEELRK